MTHLGSLALYLAFVLALYAITTSLWGASRRQSVWIASGTHAAYAVFGCVGVAVAALLHALVTRDFNVEYVAAYSSSTLPLRYTVAALWGGQKGSLLFWTFILTFFSTVVHIQNRTKNRELMPYVTATLMTIALFFLGLLCFITPPLSGWRSRAVQQQVVLSVLVYRRPPLVPGRMHFVCMPYLQH